jgi:hypothetical protein
VIELSDTLTLKSITGYREDSSTSPIDFDSLPAIDLDVPAIYENDQLSQELQLLYEDENLPGGLGFYHLDANAFTAFDGALFTTVNGLTAQTLPMPTLTGSSLKATRWWAATLPAMAAASPSTVRLALSMPSSTPSSTPSGGMWRASGCSRTHPM